MNQPTYDHQALTQYLLGSLPAAETEALDELSVTDDRLADALMATEKDLIDGYVQGELIGTELEKFKAHYLTSPHRLEKVAFAQAFQTFAEKAVAARVSEARSVDAGEAGAGRKTPGWFPALSVLMAPRRAAQWGFAVAALVMLLAGVWLAFENWRLRQQVSQTEARRNTLDQSEQEWQREIEEQRSINIKAEEELANARREQERLNQELKKAQEQQPAPANRQPPSASTGASSIVSFILAPQMRGAGQIQTVSVPPKTEYVSMRLELESNDYPGYRVALINPSNNQTLWRSRALKARTAGASKALSLSFRANLLQSQTYTLQVTGITAAGATEIISDYPFRVVK